MSRTIKNRQSDKKKTRKIIAKRNSKKLVEIPKNDKNENSKNFVEISKNDDSKSKSKIKSTVISKNIAKEKKTKNINIKTFIFTGFFKLLKKSNYQMYCMYFKIKGIDYMYTLNYCSYTFILLVVHFHFISRTPLFCWSYTLILLVVHFSFAAHTFFYIRWDLVSEKNMCILKIFHFWKIWKIFISFSFFDIHVMEFQFFFTIETYFFFWWIDDNFQYLCRLSRLCCRKTANEKTFQNQRNRENLFSLRSRKQTKKYKTRSQTNTCFESFDRMSILLFRIE